MIFKCMFLFFICIYLLFEPEFFELRILVYLVRIFFNCLALLL